MNPPTIRMYVDENGHQSLKGDLSMPEKRFLCITGVIMPIETHDEVLTPRINSLKMRYFGTSDVVLHRREILSGSGPFACLKDNQIRDEFDSDLLKIIEDVEYRVISVVIDKYSLVNIYGLLRAKDPYALALEYLMQRYQYWLQECQMRHPSYKGDILAESRGGGEDILTKNTYREIYKGRGYNPLNDSEKYYSSSEIKLKPKSSNIAGLQFVDIISHPARRYILMSNDLGGNFKPSSYEQKIVDILKEKKFRRNQNGVIEGTGTVMFPKIKK